MRKLFLLYAVFACGCSSLPFFDSSVGPKSQYSLEQATLLSPNEPSWYLMQNEIHSLVFSKKFTDKAQSTVISAAMYPAGAHKTSRAFLEFVADQRVKQDDKARFKVLSVNNEYVTFKELPCLKYQSLSEDHKDKGISSSDFEYFQTSGYICRYPLEYIAFQFEISHRSKEKEIPANLLKIAQDFFQNIRLVEPTIKRLKTIP